MDDHRAARSMVGDLDLPGFAVTAGHQLFTGVLPVVRATATRLADGLDVTLTYLPMDEGAEAMGPSGGALVLAGELSRLRHDHLIRIHDVVPLAGLGAAPPRLVLATATAGGGSLTELLMRRAPLSVAETLTVVSPMAEAMTHLHRHGVVHGALTTDSVLFTDRGMPLLADAAIDRLSSVALVAMAPSGTSAPEIVEGFEATTESDAYAFAAMVWAALVGSAPGWVGDREDLAELAPHVPARVCSMLTTALSPDPGDRPDIPEIARYLADCVVAEPIDLAELDVARNVPSRIRTLASRQPATHRAPRRRGARQVMVTVVASMAVGLALVTLLLPGPLNLITHDVLASTQTVAPTSAPVPQTDPTASSERTTPPEATPEEAIPMVSTPDAAIPEEPDESAATETPPGAAKDDGATAIIQTLIDARAGAWQSADPDLLVGAHSVGSDAMTSDRDDLEAATADGTRLSNLAFEVSDVEVVKRRPLGATSVEEADELTARVTVRREPLTVTAADGDQTQVAGRSDDVDVTLRREPVGWRFVSWS